MKKIVLSAISAIVLTVGVYHVALLLGASELVAFAAAVVAAFAAKEEKVRPGWAFAAYGIEVLAIGGALMVGTFVPSLAMMLGGIGLIAGLYILERRDHPVLDTPVTAPNNG